MGRYRYLRYRRKPSYGFRNVTARRQYTLGRRTRYKRRRRRLRRLGTSRRRGAFKALLRYYDRPVTSRRPPKLTWRRRKRLKEIQNFIFRRARQNIPRTETERDSPGFLNRVISSLPMEMHIPLQHMDGRIGRGNFAGPGTKLYKRLGNYNPKTGYYSHVNTQPVNYIDWSAMEHDICYGLSTDAKSRNRCDRKMAREMSQIIANPDTTVYNRMVARFIKRVMEYKIKHGV